MNQPLLPPGAVPRIEREFSESRRRAKRRGSRFFRVLLGLICVLVLGAGIYAYLPLNGVQQTLLAQSFSVGPYPHLTIRGHVSNIQVHPMLATSTENVRVTARTQGRLLYSTPVVTATVINENQIIVMVSVLPFNPVGEQPVVFDVAVPVTTDLQLQAGVGDIAVQGVSGELHLRTDSGSITIGNSTLIGNGDVQTTVGSVTFDGNLADNATYSIQAVTGSLTLTLPASATFALNARSTLGQIHNAFGNSVSTPLSPSLRLQTEVGTIVIQKQLVR